MSGPLEKCSVFGQGSSGRFLLSEGISPSHIYKHMLAQYRIMNELKNVYKWAKHFNDGYFNVEDEHRSRIPVQVSIPSLQQ